MINCKDGKCACSDISTKIETDITWFEKAKAHIKGDIFSFPLNGREYYYLMFGCVNATQIDEVKQIGHDLALDSEDKSIRDMLMKKMENYKGDGWGVKH